MSSSEMGPMLRIKILVFTTVGSPEKVKIQFSSNQTVSGNNDFILYKWQVNAYIPLSRVTP